MSHQTVLKVSHVHREFQLAMEKLTVLHDVNFEVKQGSFTILYGPSGSGKSTMLNILLGLDPPTSGTVEMLGQDMYKLNPDGRAKFRHLALGMVYQSNFWISSLNVIENVAFPLYLAGHTFKTAEALAQQSLKNVGMDGFEKQMPTRLSGGQQQRVSMARALVSNPQIIVADEPTGNLDSKNGDMIMDLLAASVKDMGKTVILVTHNLEYLRYSDQQLQIKDGQIIDSNTKTSKETKEVKKDKV